MKTQPLSPMVDSLKELADWHLEKQGHYAKNSRNRTFHKYRRSQLLLAAKHLDNARMCLPSDF